MIWCLIIIGLWGVCIGLAILSAVWMMVDNKRHTDTAGGIFACAGIGAIILLIISIIFAFIVGICSAANYSEKASLEAFYTSNVQNYADAANMSNNILLQAKFADGIGDIGEGLAYQGQSAEVTKAILEWRDSVNAYNLQLAGYKAWRANPWSSWFYYDVNAEYLTIQ